MDVAGSGTFGLRSALRSVSVASHVRSGESIAGGSRASQTGSCSPSISIASIHVPWPWLLPWPGGSRPARQAAQVRCSLLVADEVVDRTAREAGQPRDLGHADAGPLRSRDQLGDLLRGVVAGLDRFGAPSAGVGESRCDLVPAHGTEATCSDGRRKVHSRCKAAAREVAAQLKSGPAGASTPPGPAQEAKTPMRPKRTSRSAQSIDHLVLGRAVREVRARRRLSQEEAGARSDLHRNYRRLDRTRRDQPDVRHAPAPVRRTRRTPLGARRTVRAASRRVGG